MGLKEKLLHRVSSGSREQAQADDAQLAGFANSQVYTRNQNTAQEAEDRQQKGIDYDMIYAEQAVSELNKLAHYTELLEFLVPSKDASGNIVLEDVALTDDSGKIVYEDVPVELAGTIFMKHQPKLVKRPRMVKEVKEVQRERLWASAALVYLDTVMPTIWMGSYEADTAKMYVRTAFHDIRKQMRHDPSLTFDQKRECTLLLRAARDLALFRCEDTKEGRKPLLLKVRREELGVHMTKGSPNVKGK